MLTSLLLIFADIADLNFLRIAAPAEIRILHICHSAHRAEQNLVHDEIIPSFVLLWVTNAIKVGELVRV